MAQSARELTAVTWGQELAIALGQCNTSIRYCDDPDSSEAKQPSMQLFGRRVKLALRDVWKEAATDVFDIGYIYILSVVLRFYRRFHRSPEEVARIDRLAEEIGIVQDLRNSYQPILNVILLALDAPPVFVRTKALRALGQIVTSDPTILTAVGQFTRINRRTFQMVVNRPPFVGESRAISLTARLRFAMPLWSSLAST